MLVLCVITSHAGMTLKRTYYTTGCEPLQQLDVRLLDESPQWTVQWLITLPAGDVMSPLTLQCH